MKIKQFILRLIRLIIKTTKIDSIIIEDMVTINTWFSAHKYFLSVHTIGTNDESLKQVKQPDTLLYTHDTSRSYIAFSLLFCFSRFNAKILEIPKIVCDLKYRTSPVNKFQHGPGWSQTWRVGTWHITPKQSWFWSGGQVYQPPQVGSKLGSAFHCGASARPGDFYTDH